MTAVTGFKLTEDTTNLYQTFPYIFHIFSRGDFHYPPHRFSSCNNLWFYSQVHAIPFPVPMTSTTKHFT